MNADTLYPTELPCLTKEFFLMQDDCFGPVKQTRCLLWKPYLSAGLAWLSRLFASLTVGRPGYSPAGQSAGLIHAS